MHHKIYDFVVVGAGPAGLAFAQVVATQGMSVKILEQEQSLGGCHRVRRVDGAFTEHGPRVYGNQYKTFQMLLDQMKIPFEKFFVPYRFNLLSFLQQTLFETMNFKEYLAFFSAFVVFMILPMHGKDITMSEFMQRYQFSMKTRDIVERVCVMTDGATADRYTLYAFLQLLNQHAFYRLYQPNVFNDIGLMASWGAFLTKHGVSVTFGAKVISVHADHVIYTDAGGRPEQTLGANRNAVLGKHIVLAVPPVALARIMQFSPRKDLFGPWDELMEWAQRTKYLNYQSYTLHYHKKLTLKKTFSFVRSEWGIICVPLSDYMNGIRGTLLSCAVTLVDRVSPRNLKTAQTASPQEIRQEILDVLRQSYGDLPEPDLFLSGSSDHDTAFVGFEFMQAQSRVYPSVFTLGTHNGASPYAFTTMESAVQNGVALANTFVPEKWPMPGLLELRHVLYALIALILFYLLR